MNELKSIFKDGKLTIHMTGHIDSNNASEVGEELARAMEGKDLREMTINMKGLNYISSAGLRVLLRARKALNKLHIVNVGPEVYDILDMTGFTQMLSVEKAYREVSIEGAEVIGQGANGTLYRIDKDNVVKVYNNADALEDIQHEREMAKVALVLGIPTAISYDVVKVGEHYGSVFELLNARSFANILVNEPDRFDWCVKEFTDMMNRIHGTLVPKGKLPDIRAKALEWVEFLKDHLDQEVFEKARRLVRAIPEDNHMIHGDYHIKNLELQDGEVLLIDMDTLAVGHPIFELGFMYNSFLGFSEYDTGNVKQFLGIDYETADRFFHKVLARYLATNDPERLKEVEEKARIIGYIRLIRRSIRRKGLEDPAKREEIELWKIKLKELLAKVDSLVFIRDEVEFDADEEKLHEVLRFVDDHLEAYGCDMKTQMQIDVSVEEAFINVARYAYGTGSGMVRINMRMNKDPRFTEIVITDSGMPFDPLAKEDPDTTLSAEERKIGGLGIYMIKKSMDDVQYEYKDGQNILTMKKYLQ